MYKILFPFSNLANDNMMALTRLFLTAGKGAESDPLGVFWRSAMENQARFVHDYTHELLAVLAQNRQLVSGEIDKLTERTGHVTDQLAHSAVRAVGIATQARREKRDRRVFPLPLPAERRSGGAQSDRRQSFPALVGIYPES